MFSGLFTSGFAKIRAAFWESLLNINYYTLGSILGVSVHGNSQIGFPKAFLQVCKKIGEFSLDPPSSSC